MNIDKTAPIAAVAISLIALFVPFEYWGLLLVIIGLAHGVMSVVDDRAGQAMIYALAIAAPAMSATLGSDIPVVGEYGKDFLDNLTSGIHGYAVAALVMDIKARIMG